MERKELISKVKELGLTTNKPPHMCTTAHLEEVLNSSFNISVSSVGRGRKINPESSRQKRLAELEAKRQAGTLKRGRPFLVK